ncbi:MAG: DUF362 domain-containing protein [Candidatus Latescibacterota bacterium]
MTAARHSTPMPSHTAGPAPAAAALLKPVVAERPEAVFILRTGVQDLDDPEGFAAAGYAIARALFRERGRVEVAGYRPILKPNVVTADWTDAQGQVLPSHGVVTDAHFVGGIARFLQEAGYGAITIAEGGDPVAGEDGEYTMDPAFRDRGYRALADRMGLELVGLNRRVYAAQDLVWRHLGDSGVVYREIPFVRPLPGDLLINVPTLKTHNHAIVSLCAKNLQGAIAVPYRHHCEALERLEHYPEEVLQHLQPCFGARIRQLCDRHEREGYWRMNPGYEIYAQRTCDTVLALRPQPAINIVEGIRGRDGTAFHRGRDWLVNLVIAGVNPVHVDTIACYLMGQTPRAVVAYLRIAEERGLGTCDPFAIPTYVVGEEGQVTPRECLTDLQIHPFLDVLPGNGSLAAHR